MTADGRLAGRVAFKQVDLEDGLAKVAYWVVPEARGRGVAPRALRTAAGWMLDVVGMHRLEVLHSTHNAASCRVAEKAGFTYEAVLRSHTLHFDGWHDMHLHALVAGDPPPRG